MYCEIEISIKSFSIRLFYLLLDINNVNNGIYTKFWKGETMKILSMPIKKQWFDMILAGDKKEEYRAVTKFYTSRLVYKGITHLKFINGYGRDKPFLVVELKNIIIGTGKEEWGAVLGEQYYVLGLGEVIERGNLK